MFAGKKFTEPRYKATQTQFLLGEIISLYGF